MKSKQLAQLGLAKTGRNRFVDLSGAHSSANFVQPYENLKFDEETMEVAKVLASMQKIHDGIEHKKNQAVLAIQQKALEKKTSKREQKAPGKIKVRTAARPINHPYATRSKSIRRNTDSSK
ncbi:hypothetical protein CAEBREN_22090 [Caenorhabditis brenneri]|uniref:Uncharacterized protein n=1 Tax=Caenorhabditis brenneri TaxID=135651 RepID=G0NFG4_CAEBE|nr:hypothetical protein CAEBREN_22090 [Caenorhabditis brenneri]